MAVAMILAATWHLAGCIPVSLPTVPEDAVRSVEGDQVTIVERVKLSNPTDEWIYTYLMLEVDGDEPRLDTVASTLAANGWDVRYTESLSEIELVAGIPDVADLTLIEFDEYMDEGRSWVRAGEEFGRVSTSDDKGYFVAILMPIG